MKQSKTTASNIIETNRPSLKTCFLKKTLFNKEATNKIASK